MKTEHKFLIFVYFLCVILITMTLFSFILNTVVRRLLGDYPRQTKIYYLEYFGIWLVIVYIMFNLRTNFNNFSKKKLTNYVSSNGEIGEYDEIYSQIDEMEKFNGLLIVGFVVIFFSSHQHTYKEKLSLLNEDIGIISEAFE